MRASKRGSDASPSPPPPPIHHRMDGDHPFGTPVAVDVGTRHCISGFNGFGGGVPSGSRHPRTSFAFDRPATALPTPRLLSMSPAPPGAAQPLPAGPASTAFPAGVGSVDGKPSPTFGHRPCTPSPPLPSPPPRSTPRASDVASASPRGEVEGWRAPVGGDGTGTVGRERWLRRAEENHAGVDKALRDGSEASAQHPALRQPWRGRGVSLGDAATTGVMGGAIDVMRGGVPQARTPAAASRSPPPLDSRNSPSASASASVSSVQTPSASSSRRSPRRALSPVTPSMRASTSLTPTFDVPTPCVISGGRGARAYRPRVPNYGWWARGDWGNEKVEGTTGPRRRIEEDGRTAIEGARANVLGSPTSVLSPEDASPSMRASDAAESPAVARMSLHSSTSGRRQGRSVKLSPPAAARGGKKDGAGARSKVHDIVRRQKSDVPARDWTPKEGGAARAAARRLAAGAMRQRQSARLRLASAMFTRPCRVIDAADVRRALSPVHKYLSSPGGACLVEGGAGSWSAPASAATGDTQAPPLPTKVVFDVVYDRRVDGIALAAATTAANFRGRRKDESRMHRHRRIPGVNKMNVRHNDYRLWAVGL